MSRVVLAFAATAVIGSSVSAQWLNYPTAGVPKLADGKPNLQAPAPRATDGKVDFSGLWELTKNRPCPAEGCRDSQVNHEFANIGWSLKGGLPYQPWAAAEVEKNRANLNKDDPTSRCMPLGLVKQHTAPDLRKVVQVPGLIVALYERNAAYRQIFTDGRPLPVDPNPSWNGYSSAKWDGDTLLVESNGFRDGIWLDTAGSPLMEGARISEKWRRANFGTMEIEMTLDDPKSYTKPWTITLKYNLALDTDMLDYICLENEKDTGHLVGK